MTNGPDSWVCFQKYSMCVEIIQFKHNDFSSKISEDDMLTHEKRETASRKKDKQKQECVDH